MLAHAFSMRRATPTRDNSAENRRYSSTAVRFPNRNDQKALTQRFSRKFPHARPRTHARRNMIYVRALFCRSRRVLVAVAFGHAPSPAPFPPPRARFARPRSHAAACSNHAADNVQMINQTRGRHSGARSGTSGSFPRARRGLASLSCAVCFGLPSASLALRPRYPLAALGESGLGRFAALARLGVFVGYRGVVPAPSSSRVHASL